jgi:hypothetical protein
MQETQFYVSIEELAMIMNVAGYPDKAYHLMVSQLGDMSKEEARIRLMTAGHSLLARKYLSIDTNGNTTLMDPVARIAWILSGADLSIRYSRSYRNADFALAFHFGEDQIYAHRVEQGVVHHIAKVDSKDSVIQGGVDFFGFAEIQSFTCPPAKISQQLLEEVKDDPSPVVIERRLASAGVPDETRSLLVEDLSHTQYRGSIMQVQYGEDNVPQADEGLLVLSGPERLWLLRPLFQNDERYVTLLPGTEEVFRQEVSALKSASTPK